MSGNLMLDTLKEEDQSALIELFASATVREFLGGALDHEVATKRAADWIACSPSEPIWAIRIGEERELVGYVLLGDHHDGEDVEISYALLPRYWGNGHARKALKEALSRAAKEFGMKEVVAETQSGNLRSIKLLHRIGMVAERHVIRFGAEQTIFRWRLGEVQDKHL